ncbi:MAG: dolichyl-phosphate beta-glucosyltransferase [Patescibacteria group bacterium]|nr:glycosyltransferase family 2 protein [Patescibacteria group bacterium]
MHKPNIKLSVVIPAYNEEKRIGPTLLDIDRYLSRQKYPYEILVVIDGATDKTFQTVKKYQSMVHGLKIINNEKNHGKGYVVRQGLLQARGEFRLFMDADNSTVVDHIEKFFPYFDQNYSLVIGSRDLKTSKITKHQPKWKELLGDAGNIMIQFIGGLWGIPDTQCGFKVLTAEAAKKICEKMIIDRWGFDIEMLVLARKMNFKIKEIAVEWENDQASNVSFLSYFNTLKELFQIRWNLITGKYKL